MNRDTMRRNQQLPGVDAISDGVILALWKQHLDTLAISRHLKCPEFQVYNRLLHIRQKAEAPA